MGKPTISAFVFATRIVQFLYFLNPKFPVSSILLCLYSPVCVEPVRKPHCWFSHEVAQEDICFFEVNTKYISSSEFKTSEFSHECAVFNSRDGIYLVFTENKRIFFLFYTIHGHFPIRKAGGENAKKKKKMILVPHCSLRSN